MLTLVAAVALAQTPSIEVPPIVRSAFRGAYFAATLGSDTNVKLNNWVTLEAKRDTKLTASMDRTSATLASDPGLHLNVKWAPDLRVKSITYDFEKKKFDVDSEAAGFSLFGLVDWAGERILEWYLNKYVAPKIPEVESLEAAGGMGALLWQAVLGKGPLAGVDLRDVSADVELEAPTDLSFRDGEVEVRIKAGTQIGLRVKTKGPWQNAKLDFAGAAVTGAGVEVRGGSDPAMQALLSARVRAIGIRGDGGMAMDYDLGLDAASQLLEFATGTSIRRELERAIARDLPPGLYQIATQYARQHGGERAAQWASGLLSGWRAGVAEKLKSIGP